MRHRPLLGILFLSAIASASEAPVTAVSDAVLANPPAQDWLMWRRTLDSWGYSPLSQIGRGNVAQLQLVWTRGLEPGPQEGTPLVRDGVLYFPHPGDLIQAIDAVTGDLLWEHRRQLPPDLDKYINAPLINRNLAIHGTLILDTSADGYVYALDARSGKEVWSTKVLDYTTGVHHTSGPIVADGKVITGRGCEPLPSAKPEYCVIVAHDAATGRELWRTRTIPGPGERGNESWGDVPFEERKHVGAWMPASYDPELKLIYIGTSVTSPAPKFLLGGNNRQHLYHNCTLALDVNTGAIVWYYQHVVDHWDLDHTFERILIDTEVAPAKDSVAWINPGIRPGQKYKVLTGIPGKTGIVYTLDRRDGKFLWARPTVQQNVVSRIDGRSGTVTVDPQAIFKARGDEALICPSIHGGRNWPSGAYSPLTGTMYFPLQNLCARYGVTIASRSEPSTYGIRANNELAPGTQNLGTIHAISASTGRTEWKFEQRAALLSLLTTGGELLFGGDVAGRFRAFDQRTGQVLWQTNLGSQVTGFPITYSVRDRQYIAVSTGQAVNTAAYLLMTPEIRPSKNSSLYVFALPEASQPSAAAAAPREGSGAATANPATPREATVSARASTAAPKNSSVPPTPAADAAPIAQCRRRSSRVVGEGNRTLDGAFTAAQSAQGRKIYAEQQCALCHGESMRGAAGTPALADPGFRRAWQGRSLHELFDCMKTTMPPGRAGTLADADYVHLLAAILEANGIAPGPAGGGLPAEPEKLQTIAFPNAR
jgi:PQQ-dependent dehydrogenase (methanol/ethanol family)